jgi:hypothetical protein
MTKILNQQTMTSARPAFMPGTQPDKAPLLSSQPGIQDLPRLLNKFSPISLEELSSVALLNRIDTKFVLTIDQFIHTLPGLQKDYRVLEIEEQRLNHYRTLYFDTPDFDLFNMHVNGQADRYKVRSREYLDSQLSFLEVKHKTRKDRTIKDRICTDKPVDAMTDAAEMWLDKVFPYDSRELEPKVCNTFTRITLAGKNNQERVTLDLNVAFSSDTKIIRLDRLVIAEIKLDGRDSVSSFSKLMREQRIQPQGFSKYCIGTSMLFEQVKKNSLKPQLLQINRLSNGA